MVCALLCGACEVVLDYRHCAAPDPGHVARAPARLSGTGLYADARGGQLAPGVVAYTPRFELWADGAQKRRFLWLPPGTRIDSGDMDEWRFPVGTKLWKEFARDGVRVETRLLEKVGAGDADWLFLAYLWDGDDARAVPHGIENARGEHDVPAAGECVGCHGGRASRVLGVSAVQLPAVGAPGELGLDDLVRRDLLSAPPARPITLPGHPHEQAALGYLHANCAHCHNQHRPATAGPRCFDPERDFDFSLRSTDRTLDDTGVFRTAIGEIIERGDPEGSVAWRRMGSRQILPPGMPPLGTEQIDERGRALVAAFIDGLAP